MALSVPIGFLPEDSLFQEGWQLFATEQLTAAEPSAARRVERASRRLWLLRGRDQLNADSEAEPAAPDFWDLARVRRRLERSLVQCGLLLRRARWLCLLTDADVSFRELRMPKARSLVLCRGEVVERQDIEHIVAWDGVRPRKLPALRDRQTCFDAATYDRLRVLATELQRVQAEGGEVALRLGPHMLRGAHLATLMRAV
jgi:hypothetical protein